MTENPDFDLESAWLIPAPADPAAAPAGDVAAEVAVAPEPVVVIQYRSRGLHPVLLLPITLLGSLALFSGYHAYLDPAEARPHAPPFVPTLLPVDDGAATAAKAFEGVQALFPPSLPLTLEGRPVPHELPAVVAAPAVAAAEPRPEPKAEPEPPPPAAEVAPAEKPSRISIASVSPDLSAPNAAAVDPAVDVAAVREVPPAVEPLPTQEEMMERIRQEAELRAIQREELERRQQAELGQLKVDSAKRAEEERSQFRRELRDILKAGAAGSGPAIEALCDQFGRTYNEGVRQRAYAILARNKGRLTSDAEVRILRSLGVPEPAVLDFLCNRVNRSLHSRNGPHDTDEVRVAAARQLLRIPTTGVPAADPTPTAPASPARSPVYRRASP